MENNTVNTFSINQDVIDWILNNLECCTIQNIAIAWMIE